MFNDKSEPYEWLLTQLFQQYPHNTDPRHVWLKVAILNVIYSTRIQAVSKVAEHIHNLKEIDHLLADGSTDAVKRIANVQIGEKKRCFYSFATKYCNWHNPTAYPIFDKNVCACLTHYSKKDGFDTFTLDGLWRYPKFKNVVDEFQKRYHLESLSYKELDKFMWQHGGELIKSKADAKSRGATA